MTALLLRELNIHDTVNRANLPDRYESGQKGEGERLNLTDASTVASAIAAVVGTGVAAATFILQLRKPIAETEPASKGLPSTPNAAATSTPAGGPTQPAVTVGSASGKSGTLAWSRRVVLSLSSGIVAGLIVLFISSFQSPGPTLSFTSPSPGTAVSRTKVFSVTGKVSHLNNDTVWLTDYDGGYAVDDEATIYDNGGWKALDSNVGDPGRPLPFSLTLRVILADVGCATKLQNTMNSNGDYLNALPGGCTVAGSITVKVATP